MGLFQFFRKAGEYVSPDESAVQQMGAAGPLHTTYHKRLVLVSIVLGALGAGLGIALMLVNGDDAQTGRESRIAFLMPFVFGAVGIILGVAVACLLAPREFLMGPVGQKWMKLIGTDKIFVARIVCFLLGLLILAPFVGVGLLIVLGK